MNGNVALRRRWTMPRVAMVACVAVAAGVVVAVGLSTRRPTVEGPRGGLVYTSRGYGGLVPARPAPRPPSTPLEMAAVAYVDNRFEDAERMSSNALTNRSLRTGERLNAQLIFAYSAARRKEYSIARERFMQLRDMAADLPDHGARKTALGDTPEPTFEEEAAFQHAACTNGMGDPVSAEVEWSNLLCNYPRSVLIYAAVKRIARLHKGNVPKEVEHRWRIAVSLQAAQQRVERREQSLCGPGCLEELLHRQGKPTDLHTLAREMRTDEHGTMMEALAYAAIRHGYRARGLELTYVGLLQQKLPVIALIQPGHYVLVDRADAKGVDVWDPGTQKVGATDRTRIAKAEWDRRWQGTALALN